MKALVTILIVGLSTTSFSQINLKGMGNKAKEKIEAKAKSKAKEKGDDAVTEATRDPKDPPQPATELFDPYMRVLKYIGELQNMADSRAEHAERTGKQVGTDMEQKIYLANAKSTLEKASEKQVHFDKSHAKAQDSLNKFNEYNTANKKGKPRFETTFQADLDAAVELFATGNTYFVEKFQSDLDRKNKIDASLKRKREIETIIFEKMSSHIGYILGDQDVLSDGIYSYGEGFKLGVSEVNWTELDELIADWQVSIASWREAMPPNSKFIYDTPDDVEHLRVKTDDRHSVRMPEGKFFENYKEWYEAFVSENVKSRIEDLVYNSKNEYPENKSYQYRDASEALYFGQGAITLFPSNSELKTSKDNAEVHYDALLKSLPGGPLHKANYAKVVTFGKSISPGSETQADIGNTWKMGQKLTGLYYMVDPAKYEFRYYEDEGGMGVIVFDVKFDNKRVKVNRLFFPLINRKNTEDPYAHFDFFPSVASLIGPYGADYERFFENMLTLPIGHYKMSMQRDPDDLAERKGPTSFVEIEIDITQDALDYFKKGQEKAIHEKLNLVRIGKAGMTDANITTAVKKTYKELSPKGQILRVVVTGSQWELNKNRYGIPTTKWIEYEAIYKDENGKCWLHKGGSARKEYNGAGYEPMYARYANDYTEMLCENANK
ncbi:MAG: hypothetical protein ACI837_003447 [Crocinitomicaceae bacterium]|jgi:hypothetical protein